MVAKVIWDHPRLRGEKVPNMAQVWGKRGSPPLARGKELCGLPRLFQLGITPACAGKRIFSFLGGGVSGDHPRLRGEKPKAQPEQENKPGSPPLARGKVLNVTWYVFPNGITPACAGKRYVCKMFCLFCQDHPRLRGEKAYESTQKTIDRGSPPLARGKAGRKSCHTIVTGITPACAGKSLPSSRFVCKTRDHPRLRGEKLK